MTAKSALRKGQVLTWEPKGAPLLYSAMGGKCLFGVSYMLVGVTQEWGKEQVAMKRLDKRSVLQSSKADEGPQEAADLYLPCLNVAAIPE